MGYGQATGLQNQSHLGLAFSPVIRIIQCYESGSLALYLGFKRVSRAIKRLQGVGLSR